MPDVVPNEALTRDILRVLCRIPIPWGQLLLYHLAIESPVDGFRSSRIREAADLTHREHRGLMGALGVRVNRTQREVDPDAKPGPQLLFDVRWLGTEQSYRPRPELLAAIDRLPPLREVLQRPLADIRRPDSVTIALPPDVRLVPDNARPAARGRGDRGSAASAFDVLLNALETADLAFPSEFVANLLLALQVKRFVILTGISGTGKTRIAQVLAKQFPVLRRVKVPVEAGDDALVVRVMPYMRKYNKLVVPVAFAGQLPQPASGSRSGKLKIRWPDGTLVATTNVRDAYTVLFKGDLKRWFASTLAKGDLLILRLEGPEGQPDTLVLNAARATEAEQRVANATIVAVQPNWTDRRGLLGAYNPLTRQYPLTPTLGLLLRAAEESDRAEADGRSPAPFFLILDEMNLARVEHYFADFLSALESEEEIHLHESPEVAEGTADPDAEALPIPRQLKIPPNLFVVGTVNVDETTYMFSPKVLDRAFTIELNTVDLGGLGGRPARGGRLDLAGWSGRLDPPQALDRSEWNSLQALEDAALTAEIVAIHRLLAEHNRHFGYRVALEVARFVRLAVEQTPSPEDAAWDALDLALLQKVLVKLHGSRHELSSVIDALLRFTLGGATPAPAEIDLTAWRYVPHEGIVEPKDDAAGTTAVFPRSAAKLWRMRERLQTTGFTSWIE